MRKIFSARLICQTITLSACATAFYFSPLAQAQAKPLPTSVRIPRGKLPSPNPAPVKPALLAPPSAAKSAYSTAPAAPAPVAAPEAPKKIPIKASYAFEYDGNTFGKSLTKTPSGDPATFGHDFRLGYQVAKGHVVGIRESVTQLLETPPGSETFTPNDWRVYVTWGNMIETSDVEMSATFDIMIPTSDASQKAQKLVSFNIKNSWTFKTELRNWSFNILTVVAPKFYQDPTSKPDLSIQAYPNITVDIGPQSHIYWELGLDATHKNEASYFDFTEGNPDYMTLGPQFDLNSHVQIYPALKFYTGNLSFKAATMYFLLTAAL